MPDMQDRDTKIRELLRDNGFIEIGSDHNLEYGGSFVRPENWQDAEPSRFPWYFDVIEITDLDSACGASGCVMLETKTVDLGYKDRFRTAEIKSAMECLDVDRRSLADMVRTQGKRYAQAFLAWCMAQYGYADTHDTAIAITDPSYAHDSTVSAKRKSWYGQSDGAYAWIGKDRQGDLLVIADHGDTALYQAIRRAV